MDLDMWQRLRHHLPTRIARVTSGKLMTALVIIIVPGGLMLPLCYAAYAAVTSSAGRKSARARLDGSTDAPASTTTRLARSGGLATNERREDRISLRSFLQAGALSCTYSAKASKSSSLAERAM